MASEQSTKDTNPRATQDMADEQVPVSHTANTSDMSSNRATADSTARTHEPGAPTEGGGGEGGGGELWDSVPYDDDEYKTKVNETEAQVAGTFQKAFSYFDREPGAPTETKAGCNTWKGAEDDDSIERQMKNTTAQVVGTFKGLSSAYQQAEEKMNKMLGLSKDSSKN